MNIFPIIVCAVAVSSVVLEISNKNYSAACWALCTAIWAGVAIS